MPSPVDLALQSPRFGPAAVERVSRRRRAWSCPASNVGRGAALLKDERGFDLLVDVTCVDYLNYRDATDRFGLVYLLAKHVTNERLTCACFLNEPEL
jgi:NADH-quinone oxidoreductase subunit C